MGGGPPYIDSSLLKEESVWSQMQEKYKELKRLRDEEKRNQFLQKGLSEEEIRRQRCFNETIEIQCDDGKPPTIPRPNGTPPAPPSTPTAEETDKVWKESPAANKRRSKNMMWRSKDAVYKSFEWSPNTATCTLKPLCSRDEFMDAWDTGMPKKSEAAITSKTSGATDDSLAEGLIQRRIILHIQSESHLHLTLTLIEGKLWVVQ